MTDFSRFLVVSDIDGTFLDSRGGLVKRNLTEVERFIRGGGLFTFATGRFSRSLYDVVPEYERYMTTPGIFSNGACLYDPSTGRCLEERFLDGAKSIGMLREVEKGFPSLTIRCTCDEGLKYLDKNDDSEMIALPWHKIVIEGDPEEVDRASSICAENRGEEYYCSKSCPFILELLRPDATKGTMLDALTKLLRKQGKSFSSYAIGDYENDIPMLERADFGVCPDNAGGEVKSHAKLTVCGCDGGSVGELINYLTNL